MVLCAESPAVSLHNGHTSFASESKVDVQHRPVSLRNGAEIIVAEYSGRTSTASAWAAIWLLRKSLNPSFGSAPSVRMSANFVALRDYIKALLRRALLNVASRWRKIEWRSTSTVVPAIVSVMIGLAIAARSVEIGRSLLQRDSEKQPVVIAFPPQRARSAVSAVDTITKAHLFGIAPPGSGSDLTESTQPLLLTGTFAAPQPEHGLAILGEKVESVHLYTVGARISGGAVLQQVFTDHVVLNRGGQLEQVKMLERSGSGGKGTLQPVAAATQPAADSDERIASAGEPSASPVVHMKKFSLLPVFGDRDRGARVGMPTDPAEFGKSGLRAGDIISAVNGVAVHSAQSAATMLSGAGGGSVTLTVQRGGETEKVVVDALE